MIPRKFSIIKPCRIRSMRNRIELMKEKFYWCGMIDSPPICIGNNSNIVFCFHSSFYFKRIDTGLLQFI